MAIQLPQPTDKLNSPAHSLSHRVFANDNEAPALTVIVDENGNTKIGNNEEGNYNKIDNSGVTTLIGTAKRRLTTRPMLIASKIAATTKPTTITYGAYVGYSLPLYATDEELFFRESVPGRWDGESDITFRVYVVLNSAEDVGDKFNMQLSWANKSCNSGVIANTTTDVEVETTILESRNAQYSIYCVDFTIDWDLLDPDIADGDILSGRLRRIDATTNEIDGEIIVIEWITLYNVNKMFKA